MTKTVLFVTYGGGHARMVTPVVRELSRYPEEIRCETLALTTGGPIFKSEGLPYKGYKDFITPDDKEALAWGNELAATFHQPGSGMEKEESVAYLGLSYWDLVVRHGEAEAARLWEREGRHAFLQLSVMDRVIDQAKPDIVVTTNSPKTEHAAVVVAKTRGIPTLSMVDLFGVQHFYTLESDYITVLSEFTIDNLIRGGVKTPRSDFFITGNPAFDPAIDYRGPVDHDWRRTHFPSIPAGAKVLLWLDQPAYWNMNTHSLHVRSNEEMLVDLDILSAAAEATGSYLLVRPHPSQQPALFEGWLKRTGHGHVLFGGGMPLYPQLKGVDAVITHTSTAGLEGLLMERPLILLSKRESDSSDMPLEEWGLAWKVHGSQDLPDIVWRALHDEAEWNQIKRRIAFLLPQDKAAPKVAMHILRILSVPEA